MPSKISLKSAQNNHANQDVYKRQVFRASRASCFFKSVFCNSCSDFYTKDSIPSNCSTPLSVDDFNFGTNIKVYPNPFESSFTIEGVEGTIEISIYNSLGQLIFKDETFDETILINLLTGLYFLNIKHLESNKSYTTKLIRN